jgi:uncharacterized membrane protein
MLNIKALSIVLADKIVAFLGSWKFIVIQSSLLTIWLIINILGLTHFDPYPFILLNLFLSFEAAYATPLILMSANRQSEKDREHLLHDIKLDEDSYAIVLNIKQLLAEVQEDLELDRQTLKNHSQLKEDHIELKSHLTNIREDMAELKKIISEKLG